MLYMEIYVCFVVFVLQDKYASPRKNSILKHENSISYNYVNLNIVFSSLRTVAKVRR